MPFPSKKLLFILIFTTFAQQAVQAQSTSEQITVACSIRRENIELKWTRVQNVKSLRLPAKIGSTKLPLKYTVFTVSHPLLKKYMSLLKAKQGNIILPMPEDMGCSEFAVVNSGTMSSELAAKYPQIVSLKGADVKNKTTMLRLDYNGTELNAEINIGGIPYIIAPWKKGSVIYYLLYKKEDSGVERKPMSR